MKTITKIAALFFCLVLVAVAQTTPPGAPIPAFPNTCPRPFLDQSMVQNYIAVESAPVAGLALSNSQFQLYGELVYGANYAITAALRVVNACEGLIDQIRNTPALSPSQVGTASGLLIADEDDVVQNAIAVAENISPVLFSSVLTDAQRKIVLNAQASVASAQATVNTYYWAYNAGFLSAPFSLDSFFGGYPYSPVPTPGQATTTPTSAMARLVRAFVAQARASHANNSPRTTAAK